MLLSDVCNKKQIDLFFSFPLTPYYVLLIYVNILGYERFKNNWRSSDYGNDILWDISKLSGNNDKFLKIQIIKKGIKDMILSQTLVFLILGSINFPRVCIFYIDICMYLQ